jgi:enamine deaminase RidA (YjgF/YER057c/UK114 family)
METRERIETPLAPPSIGFRSQGLLAGGLLFAAGQVGVPLRAPGELGELPATLEEQVAVALGHLTQVTRAADVPLERVVDVSAFLVPRSIATRKRVPRPYGGTPTGAPVSLRGRDQDVGSQIEAYLGLHVPLLHVEQVTAVALHGHVELDWIAIQDAEMSVAAAVEILAPFGRSVGATRSGPFVIVNGVYGEGQNLAQQTRNALRHAATILEQHGSSLGALAKMAVYIADFDSYPQFNDVTKEVFHDMIPPARSVLVAPALTGFAAHRGLLRLDLIALHA